MRPTVIVSALTFLLAALAAAPARAERLSEPERIRTFMLFGMKFCMPEAATEPGCDVRLPAVDAAQRTLTSSAEEPAAERVLRFLGFRVCFGETTPDTRCDLRIPKLAPDPEADDRQARL